jgi:hypothetical protein
MLVLATATVALAVVATNNAANAANPNVPSWSPYAILDAPSARAPAPATAERRAAFVDPDKANAMDGFVDYRSVGLSSDPNDCNDGCALSNGD